MTDPYVLPVGRSDERKEPRTSICLLVEQIGKDQVYFDKTRDLSAQGMFIETDRPASLGEKLTLRFALPGQFPVVLAGSVARVVPKRSFIFKNKQPGMGIRFVDVDAQTRRLLDDFVQPD